MVGCKVSIVAEWINVTILCVVQIPDVGEEDTETSSVT